MTAFVSLFRGINVGGRHHVRMDDLKDMHEALGLKDVFPYIQSGNVVFTSDDADVARLRRHIEDGFEKKFGFRVEVIVRTSAELQEIIDQNPFQSQPGKESKWVVVMFLAARPDATAQEDLLKTYAGPEEQQFDGEKAENSWNSKKLEYHSPIAETAPALSSVGTCFLPSAFWLICGSAFQTTAYDYNRSYEGP